MIFNINKKYSLNDIERLFSKIPLVFIILLASLLLIISYFLLESKKKAQIDLLNQKYLLEYRFNKKENLNNFKILINKKVKKSFLDVENKLKELTYKSIGYIQSNELKNENSIKQYLKKLENENKIEVVFFKKDNLDVLYGKESLTYINNLIFTSKNNKKNLDITLKYIYSQGKNNMQYWRDDVKKTIRLSFFNSFYINGSEYFFGSFSTINSIREITKKSILLSINKNKKHFWFYDIVSQNTYNFKNNKKYLSTKFLLEEQINKPSYEILRYYLNSYDFNSTFKKHSYYYKKFNFLINVSYNEKLSNENIKNEIKKIKSFYINLFLQIFILILVITALCILFTFVFTNFIKKIFNEYNSKLNKKTLSLEHWKKRFELAIIAANDGLWDIDFKSKKIYFSNIWLEMFGYKKNEIQDFASWFKLIHNEDKKQVELLFDKIFAKQSDTIICEYRLKTKNDGFKYVLARGKVFLDDEGNLERMLMMSMDIDKNKRMKKELLDVELLVEDGKIVIFKVFNDENLSVSYISNSIKTYGYVKKDFENKSLNFLDLIYKDDIPKIKVAINAALNTNLNDFTFVCRIVNAANEIRWISCRSILIKNHSGEVSHFYGYINDITKIKVSQEELKIKVKKEVEKNRQKDQLLIQQSKLAAMGEMLGAISHQWRQPLNNLSLILQFLRDNYQSAEAKILDKFTHRANTHIQYLSDTIDDFRNFYKPSKNKNIFVIKDCFDSLLYMMKNQYENENIKIIYTCEESLSIENYENELKQAVLNILNNARDALVLKKENQKFDAYINIEIKKEDNKLLILISNNGGEIKENILNRIFEPYFTTKFENQGTGIGLYMTKSIIENNMLGLIKVTNIKDGVEFLITLKGLK